MEDSILDSVMNTICKHKIINTIAPRLCGEYAFPHNMKMAPTIVILSAWRVMVSGVEPRARVEGSHSNVITVAASLCLWRIKVEGKTT